MVSGDTVVLWEDPGQEFLENEWSATNCGWRWPPALFELWGRGGWSVYALSPVALRGLLCVDRRGCASLCDLSTLCEPRRALFAAWVVERGRIAWVGLVGVAWG